MANILSGRKWVGVTMDCLNADGSPDPNIDGGNFLHKVQDKYLRAVVDVMDANPVAIPSLGRVGASAADLIDKFDGLLFTGSVTNVHPSHYGVAPTAAAEPYDPGRDATTLSLLPAALEAGLPTFCVCRGFQELNVVCGGTLTPQVSSLPGRLNHGKPDSTDLDVSYGPNHELVLTEGGYFEQLVTDAGLAQPLWVNSLHYQAIDQLGEGLAIEATAPDGTVEAVRYKAGPGYNLGVQWHPEYKANRNDLSRVLFSDFAAKL